MHCAQVLNPPIFHCTQQSLQALGVPFKAPGMLCPSSELVSQPSGIPDVQQGVRTKAQAGRAGIGQNKEWQMAEGSKTAHERSDESLAASCVHKNSAAGQGSESQENLELKGDRGSSQSPAGPAASRTARHGWAHQTAHGWRPTSHWKLQLDFANTFDWSRARSQLCFATVLPCMQVLTTFRTTLQPSEGTVPETYRKRWGNSEDVPTHPFPVLLSSSQFFLAAILSHSKVQILFVLGQLSYYPCFPSKHGDQSFLTSMINSHLCAAFQSPPFRLTSMLMGTKWNSNTHPVQVIVKQSRQCFFLHIMLLFKKRPSYPDFKPPWKSLKCLSGKLMFSIKIQKGDILFSEGDCTFPFQPWPQLKYYNNDRWAPPIRGFPFLDFSGQFSRVLRNILISCLSTLYSPAMLLMKMALIETENLLSRVRAVLHVRAKQAAPGTEHQKDSIKQKEYTLPTGTVSFHSVDSI